jgi:protein SERAC1
MATGAIVFRVTGLPSHQTDDELTARLKSFITENLQEEERLGIYPKIGLVPSCHEHGHGPTALVDFVAGIPCFLSHLIENPLGDWPMEMDDHDINFDRHFHGFTQLYATEPGAAVTAD